MLPTNEKSHIEPDVSSRFSSEDSSRSQRDAHRAVKKDLSKNGIDKIHTSSSINGDVESNNVDLLSNSSRTAKNRKASMPQTDAVPLETGRTPSYMSHTVCSLEHIRRNSSDVVDGHRPRKASLQQHDQEYSEQQNGRHDDTSKRSSSGRPISCSADTVFEDIYDLEQLEQMLEIVVGYEQRRRIRAQMRLVKRQNISSSDQDKSKSASTVKTSRNDTHNKTTSVKPTGNGLTKTPHTIRKDVVADSQTVQTNSIQNVRKEEVTAAQKHADFIENPQLDPTLVRKLDASRIQQQRSFEEVKPLWATQNILKKASDQPTSRKVTTTVKKVTTSRTQPFKSVEEVDCVTSSYGIGPTDDYGKPLFGISALKRKTTTQQQSKGKPTLTSDLQTIILQFLTFL